MLHSEGVAGQIFEYDFENMTARHIESGGIVSVRKMTTNEVIVLTPQEVTDRIQYLIKYLNNYREDNMNVLRELSQYMSTEDKLSIRSSGDSVSKYEVLKMIADTNSTIGRDYSRLSVYYNLHGLREIILSDGTSMSEEQCIERALEYSAENPWIYATLSKLPCKRNERLQYQRKCYELCGSHEYFHGSLEFAGLDSHKGKGLRVKEMCCALEYLLKLDISESNIDKNAMMIIPHYHYGHGHYSGIIKSYPIVFHAWIITLYLRLYQILTDLDVIELHDEHLTKDDLLEWMLEFDSVIITEKLSEVENTRKEQIKLARRLRRAHESKRCLQA
jgi:hypothetical protein